LAGRAYALLNLYRATGERVWIERARRLAERAARWGSAQEEHPHSLWKGDLGLAVLAADLERPEAARMPFFEPLGYRAAAR
jgi:serine/threonine-protein kinase